MAYRLREGFFDGIGFIRSLVYGKRIENNDREHLLISIVSVVYLALRMGFWIAKNGFIIQRISQNLQ